MLESVHNLCEVHDLSFLFFTTSEKRRKFSVFSKFPLYLLGDLSIFTSMSLVFLLYHMYGEEHAINSLFLPYHPSYMHYQCLSPSQFSETIEICLET